MNKTPARTSTILAALLVMAGAAIAQTPATQAATATPASASPSASHAQADRVARADAAFIKQAAQNGHAEVESSKLALTKASNAQVKTFAQQMVDDHTKANNELATLARSKGIEVPTEPSLAQKAKMKVLSVRDGDSFDRHYADAMGVKAHEDTIKLFRKASAEASDPDIKAFAIKTLPTLEHHLQMAKDLKAMTDKTK